MSKLSDLVSRSSEVTGVPVATVREISRRLREAGLIRTGTGGRYGGADMTPGDASSLLTALMLVSTSAGSLSDIALLTKSHLRDLISYGPGRWGRQLGLPQLCRLNRSHTFGDAFSALLASISSGDLERSIKKLAMDRPRGIAPNFELTVKINNPRPHREAFINFDIPSCPQWMIYLRPRDKMIVSAPRKWSEISDDPGGDLRVSATIQEPTLKAIGLLLRNSETEHG
jgi:hypothetical protein